MAFKAADVGAAVGPGSSARSSHSQSSQSVPGPPSSSKSKLRSAATSWKLHARSLLCLSTGKETDSEGRIKDIDIEKSKTADSSAEHSPESTQDQSFLGESRKVEKIEDSGVMRMTPGKVEAQPYHWPHDGSLSPENTALVIIDMQRDFCTPGGYLAHQGYDLTPTRAIIPQIQLLLSTFRTHAYPVYHTREGHRPDLSTLSSRELYRSRNNPTGFGIGDAGPMGRLLIRGEEGHDTIPELYPLESEPIIDKPGRGAFAHTDFELLLRLKGISNLVICGVTTDVCVSSTMREANDRGFDCVLIEDATAAAEEGLKWGVLQSVKEEGGIFGAVCTSESLVEVIKGKARGSVTNGH